MTSSAGHRRITLADLDHRPAQAARYAAWL